MESLRHPRSAYGATPSTSSRSTVRREIRPNFVPTIGARSENRILGRPLFRMSKPPSGREFLEAGPLGGFSGREQGSEVFEHPAPSAVA
jgi:hypothetical protein